MWEKVTDNECTIVRSFMAFVKISNPNGDEIANTSRSIFGEPCHKFVENKKTEL